VHVACTVTVTETEVTSYDRKSKAESKYKDEGAGEFKKGT
jgi:hypothetical protein